MLEDGLVNWLLKLTQLTSELKFANNDQNVPESAALPDLQLFICECAIILNATTAATTFGF